MELLIIGSLLILGLALFLVEVFLVPGITLTGIASACCLIYANYYAFTTLGVVGGNVTLALSVVGAIAVVIWFFRSKTVDRLSLKETLSYRPDPLRGLSLKVGDKGVARTRLALIGTAEFGGQLIEVKSADGFLDEKTPLIIERIEEGMVFVTRANQQD